MNIRKDTSIQSIYHKNNPPPSPYPARISGSNVEQDKGTAETAAKHDSRQFVENRFTGQFSNKAEKNVPVQSARLLRYYRMSELTVHQEPGEFSGHHAPR